MSFPPLFNGWSFERKSKNQIELKECFLFLLTLSNWIDGMHIYLSLSLSLSLCPLFFASRWIFQNRVVGFGFAIERRRSRKEKWFVDTMNLKRSKNLQRKSLAFVTIDPKIFSRANNFMLDQFTGDGGDLLQHALLKYILYANFTLLYLTNFKPWDLIATLLIV